MGTFNVAVICGPESDRFERIQKLLGLHENISLRSVQETDLAAIELANAAIDFKGSRVADVCGDVEFISADLDDLSIYDQILEQSQKADCFLNWRHISLLQGVSRVFFLNINHYFEMTLIP